MLTDHNAIKAWLKKYEIDNCTIRDNGVVDVDTWIDLRQSDIIELPIQFGTVNGDFLIQGSSSWVSLKGLPAIIVGNCRLHDTAIMSFRGIDKIIKQVDDTLTCNDTTTNILGVVTIKGLAEFMLDYDEQEDKGGPIDKIMNKYLKTGDILSCQDELLDAGFIKQASL